MSGHKQLTSAFINHVALENYASCDQVAQSITQIRTCNLLKKFNSLKSFNILPKVNVKLIIIILQVPRY